VNSEDILASEVDVGRQTPTTVSFDNPNIAMENLLNKTPWENFEAFMNLMGAGGAADNSHTSYSR
jgi:hypothetical protein